MHDATPDTIVRVVIDRPGSGPVEFVLEFAADARDIPSIRCHRQTPAGAPEHVVCSSIPGSAAEHEVLLARLAFAVSTLVDAIGRDGTVREILPERRLHAIH